MYKAVIIDDEPIIVRGLSRMIPWEKYSCEVCGTAEDGRKGLEVIRRELPDIVITDIYMPQMDGLTMAAALRSEFENMEIAILTGYRDFELIQKALHLGVSRFLLKPSNMDELEEAVRTMTEHLRKKGIDPERNRADAPEPENAYGSETDEEILRESEDQVSARNFLVKSALAYIHENFEKKLTIKDVADHVYVSQWHMSKLLNRYTGKNFSELLNTVRVEEAAKLLADPALRISDIAEMVGFLDVAHFSRVFRKLNGVSPNQYRNQL